MKRRPKKSSAADAAAPRRRPPPERTCIVCRTKRPKRELVRIAWTPGGEMDVDETGKGLGRGAYLCRVWACWSAPDRDRRLQHALKASFGPNETSVLDRWREANVHGDGTEA